MFSAIPMFIVMMFSGFGGGDLLDVMTTEGYWRAKGVTVTVEQLKTDAKGGAVAGDVSGLIKDLSSGEFKVRDAARKKLEAMGPEILPQLKPAVESNDDEVAEVAKMISEKLSKQGQARGVRQLMAIRTLGERKEASAVAVLEESLKSKEPFVAEYAATALARIQNKAVAPRPAVDCSKDVWLLPGDLMAVGQFTPIQQPQMTVDKLVDTYIASMGKVSDEEIKNRKPETLAGAYHSVLQGVEYVGNVRISGVTFGVSADVGERGDKGEKGHVIFVVRGLYNRDVIVPLLKSANSGTDLSAAYGYPVLDARQMVLLFPSNEVMIAIAGANPDEIKRGTTAMTDALKAKKGAIEKDALASQIKAAQGGGGPGWAVLKPNGAFKKNISFAAPFDLITLGSKIEKDGKIAYTVSGTGKDADGIKGAVAEVEGNMKKAAEQMRSMAESSPMYKPMLEIVESIKIEAKGTTATMSGKLPADMSSMVAPYMGFFMYSRGMETGRGAVGGGVEAPAPAERAH